MLFIPFLCLFSEQVETAKSASTGQPEVLLSIFLNRKDDVGLQTVFNRIGFEEDGTV